MPTVPVTSHRIHTPLGIYSSEWQRERRQKTGDNEYFVLIILMWKNEVLMQWHDLPSLDFNWTHDWISPQCLTRLRWDPHLQTETQQTTFLLLHLHWRQEQWQWLGCDSVSYTNTQQQQHLFSKNTRQVSQTSHTSWWVVCVCVCINAPNSNVLIFSSREDRKLLSLAFDPCDTGFNICAEIKMSLVWFHHWWAE